MRRLTCMCFSAIVLSAFPLVSLGLQPTRFLCPYLDGSPRPFYKLELGVTGDVRTGDGGPRYSQMDVRSGAALGYFHQVWQGDIDLGVRFDHVIPMRRSAFSRPSHLMELVLETRWFWRYANGTAFELQMDPGLYASTEDLLDMPISMPITAAGVYTFDPSLAFVAGLQMRPTFHYVFVPYGGVVWQPHPQFRLDATMPEARVTVHLDREWSGYAGWSWNSTTYHVKPDVVGRNRMTLTQQEMYVGVSRGFWDELRISGSLGWMMDRHVRVTRSRDSLRGTLDIDDALVMRFGVSGAF